MGRMGGEGWVTVTSDLQTSIAKGRIWCRILGLTFSDGWRACSAGSSLRETLSYLQAVWGVRLEGGFGGRARWGQRVWVQPQGVGAK